MPKASNRGRHCYALASARHVVPWFDHPEFKERAAAAEKDQARLYVDGNTVMEPDVDDRLRRS
jgi:hypothetical protein